MRLELEGGDDAEVAAGAAYGPEQILVLGRACTTKLTVGGDDVDREQVVDRQSVLPTQMSGATVEGQAGDACGRHHARGNGEADCQPRRDIWLFGGGDLCRELLDAGSDRTAGERRKAKAKVRG